MQDSHSISSSSIPFMFGSPEKPLRKLPNPSNFHKETLGAGIPIRTIMNKNPLKNAPSSVNVNRMHIFRKRTRSHSPIQESVTLCTNELPLFTPNKPILPKHQQRVFKVPLTLVSLYKEDSDIEITTVEYKEFLSQL